MGAAQPALGQARSRARIFRMAANISCRFYWVLTSSHRGTIILPQSCLALSEVGHTREEGRNNDINKSGRKTAPYATRQQPDRCKERERVAMDMIDDPHPPPHIRLSKTACCPSSLLHLSSKVSLQGPQPRQGNPVRLRGICHHPQPTAFRNMSVHQVGGNEVDLDFQFYPSHTS